MALLDDFNLAANNTDFLYRVQMALVSIAIDIQAESPATANHAARSAYALKVLANPLGFAQLMAFGFTEDAGIVVSSTDQDMKNRASAIWNAYCVQS